MAGDVTNPKDAAGRAKPQLQLVPPSAIVQMAVAMGEGAAKYGPYNWRQKPVGVMMYLGAALRHIAAYIDGETYDPESAAGKTHLGGAMASLAVLTDALEVGMAVDDRPSPGFSGVMIRVLSQKAAK